MMYNNNANAMMNQQHQQQQQQHNRRDSVQFMDPGSVDSSYRENSESDTGSQQGGGGYGRNNNNNSGAPSPMFNNSHQYGFQPSANPDENFKVAVRVRPPIPRETEGIRPFVNVVRIGNDQKSITLCEHLETEDGRGGGVYSTQSYTFDRVYGPDSKQSDVYENSARYAVNAMLQGYNATILGYGPTSTGKTYTLEGFSADENRGIVPRSTEHVFSYIQQQMQNAYNQNGGSGNVQFQVRASYVQIYNEVVSDLLKPGGQDKQLTIRQAKNRVYVDGLSEWVVRSPNEIYGLMERGTALRATGKTRLSELSSRSHAIFVIIVETIGGEDQQGNPQSFKVGKLNIVDLAGSEKVRQAGVSGLRLEETKKINWSLHELGNVISALTDPNRIGRHIPYRNSKLTHLLTDSLGGNCKTTIIACISPALEAYSESLSTLKFANRAKNIKNDATINDDVNDPRAITMKYERELKRLRMMLAEKNGGILPPGVMDGNLLNNNNNNGSSNPNSGGGLQEVNGSAMNMQTWRLQERVRDLENTLQNQGIVVNADGTVIANGGSGKDSPSSLASGGGNNGGVDNEEDKAQVERYKQLLLKQRDIMLNLTTRLNERDESILRLQEEIDAYDNHVQTLEDQLMMYQENGGGVGGSGSPINTMMNNNQQQQSHLGSGKIYSSDEADQWISSRRIVGRDGNVKFLAETTAGIPASHHQNNSNNSELLNAESKIRELLMCGAIANTSTSNSSATNFEVLENVLRNRVDASLRNILRGKTLSLQQELHSTKEALRSAEQRLQVSEAALQASSGNEGIEHVKQTLRASLDAALQMKLERALDELKRERSEKNHYATELERLSTEVSIIDQKLNGFANNNNSNNNESIEGLRQDVSRLCSVFASVENEFSNDEDNLFAKWVVAPSNNENNHNNESKKYQEQVSALQATIDNLRRQQQQQQLQHQQKSSSSSSPTAKETELTKMLDERTKSYRRLEQEHRQLQQNQHSTTNEIQELRRSLATHTKDRKALRTILDSRIRVKVDNALQSLLQAAQQAASSQSSSTALSQQQEKYLKQELSALQNLVNASIQAMDADNP